MNNIGKDWYKSRTMWINIGSIVVGLAQWLLAQQLNLPGWLSPVLMCVIAVGNILLRIPGNEPIKSL